MFNSKDLTEPAVLVFDPIRKEKKVNNNTQDLEDIIS